MKDVEPKIEAIGERTVKKRDKIKELGETKSKMSDDFGYQDEQLKELRTEVEELKARTDSELNQLREDMQGAKKFIFFDQNGLLNIKVKLQFSIGLQNPQQS